MTEPAPEQLSDDDRRIVHDLRNAINAIITSARCLALCPGIPDDLLGFVAAIESNGVRAGALLGRLPGILIDRDRR